LRIRKTDSNGDWQYGKGINDYATGELAIEENIQTRLLEWLGDCFFALQEGVDYKNLFNKGQKNNLLQAQKTVILSSYGVVGINSVVNNLDSNRKLTVTYNIDTIYGQGFQNTASGVII
jgi:hypothetical protein